MLYKLARNKEFVPQKYFSIGKYEIILNIEIFTYISIETFINTWPKVAKVLLTKLPVYYEFQVNKAKKINGYYKWKISEVIVKY